MMQTKDREEGGWLRGARVTGYMHSLLHTNTIVIVLKFHHLVGLTTKMHLFNVHSLHHMFISIFTRLTIYNFFFVMHILVAKESDMISNYQVLFK